MPLLIGRAQCSALDRGDAHETVFAAYLRLNHLAASKAAGGPNTYGKYKQSPGGAGAYRTNKKSSAH
jgi:hypothetical protein